MTIQEKAESLLAGASRNASGCLVCSCFKHARGYGWVTVQKRQMAAHRVVWVAKHGEIPSGLWVLHGCDNRACINPEHLHLGTPKQNNIECVQRGRWRASYGPAKLSPQKVKDIRNEYGRGGITQREIGRKHGVSQSAVCRIINNSLWSHAA